MQGHEEGKKEREREKKEMNWIGIASHIMLNQVE